MPGMAPCARRLACLKATAIAVLLALPAAVSGQPPDRFPSPRDWAQWDSELDRADSRLDSGRVTVWSSQVTVGDLLGDLSRQSGVALDAVPELAPFRLTVFGRDCALGSVMVSLGRLLDAYWVFPRDSTPEARRYLLAPHGVPGETMDDSLYRYVQEANQARAEFMRPEREARTGQYLAALALTPDELLAEYEKDDPWLCADLLDPFVRPFVEQLQALTSEERAALLATGELNLPLARFTNDFQRYLARWSADPNGRRGMCFPDPSQPPPRKYASPEERSEHAAVTLHWGPDALQVQLDVPDTAVYFGDVVRGSDCASSDPRRDLVRLGYRQQTPEYEAAMQAEYDAWEKSGGMRGHLNRLNEALRSLAPAPSDTTSPLLDLPVAVEAPGGKQMLVADALEMAARQCNVAVLCQYLPPEEGYLDLSRTDQANLTLRDLLARIARERGSLFWWRLDGRYLQCGHLWYRFLESAVVPEETLQQWQRMVRPGEAVAIDELASALAQLNSQQVGTIGDAFPGFHGLPINGLRVYGFLDQGQRQQLAGARDLCIADLRPDQQTAFMRYLDGCMPWLGPVDARRASLRYEPRESPAGAGGFGITVTYECPGLSDYRSILLTAPLRYGAAEEE